MWNFNNDPQSPDFWNELERNAKALVHGEENLVANLANLSSLLYHSLPQLNWSGFYLWDNDKQELVLGPFQGKPACLRIKSGRGVCGTAHQTQEIQRVDDVHTFAGHIACDSASVSELVIPLIKNGQCWGVLDLDSPVAKRFRPIDAEQLSKIIRAVLN